MQECSSYVFQRFARKARVHVACCNTWRELMRFLLRLCEKQEAHALGDLK